jgi:hypothetical protein
MKVKELAVVPHAEGLLVVCYPESGKTQQFLLTKEQAVYLVSELKSTLYKMGYKTHADSAPQPSLT